LSRWGVHLRVRQVPAGQRGGLIRAIAHHAPSVNVPRGFHRERPAGKGGHNPSGDNPTTQRGELHEDGNPGADG